MTFRKLRIALSITSGTGCMLLIALWVRSYWIVDMFGVSRSCGLLTQRGELVVVTTRFAGAGATCYSNCKLSEFETWDFRRIAKPKWSLFVAYGEETPDWANYVVFKFYALFAGLLATTLAPWLRWQFTLRTLLIATMLVAMVLGLVVWVVGKSPPSTR